jgi:hypothetical protein
MLHRGAVDRPDRAFSMWGCGTGLSFELIEEGIGPAGSSLRYFARPVCH